MNTEVKQLKNNRITVRVDENDVRKMLVLQIQLGGINRSELIRKVLDQIYKRINEMEAEISSHNISQSD